MSHLSLSLPLFNFVSPLCFFLSFSFSLVLCLFSSKFGLAFQDATMESAAAAKHDRFDTSVVEVKKEDLASFIESLQLYSTERMG